MISKTHFLHSSGELQEKSPLKFFIVMRDDKPNLIVDLTFQFALDLSMICDELDKLKKFRLSNQLFGSGTSIGANVREAQNAESKEDFIHKMKIAAKEADETICWMMSCNEFLVLPSFPELLQKTQRIMKILSKIIATSKAARQHENLKI